MKRIGVLTSGGDAPGMNAAIRSVVRCAIHATLEVVGICRGYQGLIDNEVKPLDRRSVSNIISRGGTILKTARCPEFLTKEGRAKAFQILRKHRIDGLVVIGGNGTYQGSIALSKEHDIPCIGVPGTIDNDLNGTEVTIGSDTAVNTALEAIDKIRDTATSMERIFVIEVMGRKSGFIAMQVAVGGGAEGVLIPERQRDIPELCGDIVEGNARGKVSWIIIVAEGAAKAHDVAKEITERTSLETRVVVLGHIQRGGNPTAQDRIVATRLGAEAVNLLIKGERGKALGIVSDEITVCDLTFAIQKKELPVARICGLIKMLT